MEPAARISILIPAFNEEAAIGETLRQLIADPRLAGAEILVVDDGSTDGTSAVVEKIPQATLLRHPFNRGYGSAIRTAARASKGDWLVWFDADGQHRVEDLLILIEALTSHPYDYIIGVRGNGSYIDRDRLLGKWLLRQAVNFAAGRALPDFNSGLRGFRREVLLAYLHLLPRGFGASTLTTLLMHENNHPGGTVPIMTRERVGKSTVRQVRDGLRTLGIVLHIVMLFKPLQFFGWIGSSTILIGLVYGLAKAFLRGLGFPVLASVLILLGVQAFFFGLLADQISALRRERFN